MPKTNYEEQAKNVIELMTAQGKLIASKIAIALSEADLSSDNIEQLYESEMLEVRAYWLSQNAPEAFIGLMEENVYGAFVEESLRILEMIGGEVGHA